MIEIKRERFHDVIDEALPILRENYAEVSGCKTPMNIDMNAYAITEEQDMFRAYVARNASTLIGYAAFFVTRNVHCKHLKQAVQDTLFVIPAYRSQGVAAQLLECVERELKKEGVSLLYSDVNQAHPQLARLLKNRGYEMTRSIYLKRLDGDESHV